MNKSALREFTSWLGKRSYKARLERLGIEKLQEIARTNGKKGGRPVNPNSERQKKLAAEQGKEGKR